jgi:drug/metabolite transporter (DMT)-like permease
MDKTLRSNLFLLFASFIFGANYVIAKGLMPVFLNPSQIIIIRVAVAMVFFWILAYFSRHEHVSRKDKRLLALCGLLGITINQTLFFEGLYLTTPVNAAIIHTGCPVIVLIIAHYLNADRIHPLNLIGIVLGLSGALMLILYRQTPVMTGNTHLGNVLIFINITSYSFYLVLVKPLMLRYRPLTVIKWVFTYGLIFSLPVCIWAMPTLDFGKFTPYAWFSIIYVVFGNTILAYMLVTSALKYLSAATAGFYNYSQPVIAGFIAVWIGQDTIDAVKVISALLVFAGVYFINYSQVSGPATTGRQRG